MSRDWQALEEHVQSIYSMLLNMKDENVAVARDVVLMGRDGLPHQFDVFYEFSRAGIRHRVAIECKNKSRPVEKDAVMAFRAKVNDVLGLQGIMIASKGFQSGARKYAEDNGIIAIELNELPNSILLMADRLESVALPNETTIGEPFWSLYEMQDGLDTGTPYGTQQNGRPFLWLFFSKLQASKVLESFPSDNEGRQYAVRGLPQRCLRSFILTADAFRAGFFIVFDWDPAERKVGAVEISRRDLIEQYYIGSAPIPNEPMVMPSLDRWQQESAHRDPDIAKNRNMRIFIEVLRSQSKSKVDFQSFLKF